MSMRELKQRLPPLIDSVSGKFQKTKKGEWAAPCPFCGGNDRFIVWPHEDEGFGRFHCRKCGAKGDLIDFFCQFEGCSKKDLFKKYQAPEKNSDQGYKKSKPSGKGRRSILKPEQINEKWNQITDEYARQRIKNTRILNYFLNVKRMIPADVIEKHLHKGSISLHWWELPSNDLCNLHQSSKVPVLAFLYKDADQNPCAIQYIGSNKKGLLQPGEDKVFHSGSNASDGFFITGKPINETDTVILVEAPVNALSLVSMIPDVCCLAIGSANGSKVSKLRDGLQGKKIICFFDHDEAGQKAAIDTAQALKRTDILKVQWAPETFIGLDPNDLLKNGEGEKIIHMVEQAKQASAIPIGPERFFDSEGRFMPALLCNELLENHDCFHDGCNFYTYDSGHGFWRQKHDNEISKILKSYLDTKASRSRILDALKLIEIESYKRPEELKPSTILLNCINGMLDVESMALLPHDKKYYSRYQVPINFDPQATCPRWEQFMTELFPDNPGNIKTMQQFTGYLFSPDNFLEKFLFLLGSGSNGKTTYLEVISKMLGSDNVSHLEPINFGTRFSTITLKDKLLNCVADMDTKRRISSNILKQVTSTDTIQADIKFKDPVTFKSTCKHIYGANEIPQIDDATYGFSRRAIVIKLNQRFDKEAGNKDPHLEKKLSHELPGILNWSLQGFRDILESNEIYESSQSEKDKSMFLSSIDNVKLFIDEMCVTGDKLMIRKTDLYQAYGSFCEASKLEPLGRNKFYERMVENCPEIDESAHLRPRCFLYVDLIKE